MTCPVCERPIEKTKIIACVRCFSLFPNKERQRLREMYVRRLDYSGKVEKLVHQTRERFPETVPLRLRVGIIQ